ncbi:MAG: prolyl oligopeptidase family serine peptidase [Planctomycetota bacterium]|jgi:acetyl esterase/lipase
MKSIQLKILMCIVISLAEICLGKQITGDSQSLDFTRWHDVIYGRKHGMALTMDVFTSEKAKGIGVIWVVSGSGRSDIKRIDKPSYQKCIQTLVNRGYTVFAVVHSSAPRFTLQDMVPDIHRAVRFIRFQAIDFGVNASQIGIVGASAGGGLSLLLGTAGKEGDPNNVDPVERFSSKVQAVGSFFAPTDWLDFDNKGTNILDFQKTKYGSVDPSFVFHEFDENKQIYRLITDRKRIIEQLKDCSPIIHVSRDDAPTIIVHGDADPFIPFHQSKRMINSLTKAGVPSKLVTRESKGHGWTNWERDVTLIADWFDVHLRMAN